MHAPSDENPIAEKLPDIVIRLDCQGRIQYLNRQWEVDTGLKRAACLGRTIHEIGLPAVLCDMLDFAIERVVSTKSLYEFEHPCHCAHGQTYYSNRIIPEMDEDGKVEYCLAVVRDVTARVQAEAKLGESEERFQAFIDHIPALTWMKDAEGRYVFINRLYEERFQLNRYEVYGKTDEQIWPGEVGRNYRQHDQEVLSNGQTTEFMEEVQGSDGRLYFARVTKFLVRDALGRKYIGGTCVDVTRPLERLESLCAELASILANSPEAIVSTNRDGIIQTWNSGAMRIFGYEATEMIGSAVQKLVPEESRNLLTDLLRRVIGGERVQQTNATCLCRDQSSKPVSLVMSPVPTADGTIVGTLLVSENYRLAD